MCPEVVLRQGLADGAGPVGDGAVAKLARVTGSWVTVTGKRREVLGETIQAGDRTFAFCAATIGNPHCVLPLPEVTADLARQYGPVLEVNSIFPKRANIQFMKVLDRNNIQIEIWERGAGYTLASGSSSSAAAAVAHRLGLCDASLTVHMPGGTLQIEIGKDFSITMTGPVTKVCEGQMAEEMLEAAPSL
jgi:diaminopimelate epimerase